MITRLARLPASCFLGRVIMEIKDTMAISELLEFLEENNFFRENVDKAKAEKFVDWIKPIFHNVCFSIRCYGKTLILESVQNAVKALKGDNKC